MHIWKVFFTLYVTVCTRVMVVNEFWTQRLTVLLFVTKVLGTCTCTWLKKYLMYLMPSKYCEYLYLYLNLQILKVLVLDSSTSESTWPQPCCGVEWMIRHHWFRSWLGAYMAPSHYLNQWSISPMHFSALAETVDSEGNSCLLPGQRHWLVFNANARYSIS